MTTKEQYAVLRPKLNELQWRIYLGTEAEKIGFGGVSAVARDSGSDRKTIRKGVVESRQPFLGDRVRKPGGGRKKLAETDATLVAEPEAMIKHTRKILKGCPLPTGMPSSGTSNPPVQALNAPKTQSSRWIARKKNSSAISKITAKTGSQRASTRGGRFMISNASR